MQEHIIDAKGRTLGRVATEAATYLLGKDKAATIKRNVVANVRVKIVNASEMHITDKKKVQTTYHRHTGYPGGKKTEDLGQVITKKGFHEALRRTVKGMLPTNTLRERRLKRLVVVD
ncbi:MAG TPA: uL13 family ribosomal protein [Candidatus Paceibacterota bacterium]|nr:uL13 family ribosomal protein [Candidatus Paceibacterota bacterium]